MKKIDYYGTDDNYIHLKFGDARKRYNFTASFSKEFPKFTREYTKYFDYKESQFKNPFQIVAYVFKHKIPVNFYYNFSDDPATDEGQIMAYLGRENSYISDLK